MMAPPTPCAARAAISNPSVGATPLSTEATVNRMIGGIDSFRLPSIDAARCDAALRCNTTTVHPARTS